DVVPEDFRGLRRRVVEAGGTARRGFDVFKRIAGRRPNVGVAARVGWGDVGREVSSRIETAAFVVFIPAFEIYPPGGGAVHLTPCVDVVRTARPSEKAAGVTDVLVPIAALDLHRADGVVGERVVILRNLKLRHLLVSEAQGWRVQ